MGKRTELCAIRTSLTGLNKALPVFRDGAYAAAKGYQLLRWGALSGTSRAAVCLIASIHAR